MLFRPKNLQSQYTHTHPNPPMHVPIKRYYYHIVTNTAAVDTDYPNNSGAPLSPKDRQRFTYICGAQSVPYSGILKGCVATATPVSCPSPPLLLWRVPAGVVAGVAL